MIDIIVRDLTKPPHDKDFLEFIVLENEQWEKAKQYIEELKKNEKPKTVKASELAVDTKVICWSRNEKKFERSFATVISGKIYVFGCGKDSKSYNTGIHSCNNVTLEDGTIVLPE